MFNVEQDLLLLSVISNESVQRVTVRNPADQTGVGGERDHCVSLNTVSHTKTQMFRIMFLLS